MSISPLVFLLLVLLIGVFIWRGWVMSDLLSEVATTYAGAKKVGIILGCVMGVVLCCAVAGGVGAAAYFIGGRSEGAANGGIGVVLLLALGLGGYNTYLMSTQPRVTAAAAGTPAVRSPLANQIDSMAEQQKRAREAADAQFKAMREAADRAREAMNRQPPAFQPGGGASPNPPSNPEPNTAPPRAQPPLPPTPPTAEELAAEEKAKQALAPLRAEATKRVSDFLAKAQTAADALAKPPKALRSDLDKRVSQMTDLKLQVSELETYLRALDTAADDALKGTGLDTGSQIRQKVAFIQGAGTFERASACRTFSSLFNAGLEEAQALADSAGRWRTDGNGLIISTDAGLQSRLRFLREGVSRASRDLAEARQKLSRPF